MSNRKSTSDYLMREWWGLWFSSFQHSISTPFLIVTGVEGVDVRRLPLCLEETDIAEVSSVEPGCWS